MKHAQLRLRRAISRENGQEQMARQEELCAFLFSTGKRRTGSGESTVTDLARRHLKKHVQMKGVLAQEKNSGIHLSTQRASRRGLAAVAGCCWVATASRR